MAGVLLALLDCDGVVAEAREVVMSVRSGGVVSGGVVARLVCGGVMARLVSVGAITENGDGSGTVPGRHARRGHRVLQRQHEQ
jgi:hypothetical protein